MELEKVRDIIAETLACDAAQIAMETSLKDDLGADSLDSVELVMALEEAFGLTIEEEKLAEFKTVGDIVDYLSAVQDCT